MNEAKATAGDFISLFLWVVGIFLSEPPRVALFMMLAVLLHEMGHLCAFLLLREPLPHLRIGRLGFLMHACRPLSYKRQVAVAFAGPFVNLLCFALALVTGAMGAGAYLHLFLALGNLLPIEALDGGRMLEGALGARLGPKQVYGICRAVSFLTLCAGLLGTLGALWIRGGGAYLFFLFFSLFVRHLATATHAKGFRRI